MLDFLPKVSLIKVQLTVALSIMSAAETNYSMMKKCDCNRCRQHPDGFTWVHKSTFYRHVRNPRGKKKRKCSVSKDN